MYIKVYMDVLFTYIMNIVKLQDIKLIPRNPLHSYTLMNNEKTEREIKETTPFTIVTKKKILRNKST